MRTIRVDGAGSGVRFERDRDRFKPDEGLVEKLGGALVVPGSSHEFLVLMVALPFEETDRSGVREVVGAKRKAVLTRVPGDLVESLSQSEGPVPPVEFGQRH